jgi:methionyl-tRNA synthetase
LIEPHSALSGDTQLELRASHHLFLRQSLLVDRLDAWVGTRRGWPPFVLALARSWLTADLRDRCITRDLGWGVPVPRAGFEGKVFYVWFDAPIGYIAATQEWAEAAGTTGATGGGRRMMSVTSSFWARTTYRFTP